MRRREFVALLGAASALWPVAARAQQPLPVIGLLSVRTPQFDAPLVQTFKQGMSQTGYVEGKNVTIDYRWAGGHFDRLAGLAQDIVREHVTLIVTFGGTASAQAAKKATSTVPITFAIGDDPVKFGLVASLNQPGGNVTGATNFYGELAAKQFGLLRNLVPTASLIAFMANPSEPAAKSQISDAQTAAQFIGQELVVVRAGTESEIDAAFADIAQRHAGALLLGANPFFAAKASQLISLANRYAIPTMYWRREMVEAGGLVSYGANPTEIYSDVGRYAGRILSGAKPRELPVQQPTKIELVLNLKTAKGMGLEISPQVLALADRVIE